MTHRVNPFQNLLWCIHCKHIILGQKTFTPSILNNPAMLAN
jgi:hypothetical protein